MLSIISSTVIGFITVDTVGTEPRLVNSIPKVELRKTQSERRNNEVESERYTAQTELTTDKRHRLGVLGTFEVFLNALQQCQRHHVFSVKLGQKVSRPGYCQIHLDFARILEKNENEFQKGMFFFTILSTQA